MLVPEQPEIRPSAVSSAGSPLLIGATSESNPAAFSPFEGFLDLVRVWEGALSPEEVAAGASAPVDATDDRLRGLWRFDEPSGATALDSSASLNDGTLEGGTGRISRIDLSVTDEDGDELFFQCKLEKLSLSTALLAIY